MTLSFLAPSASPADVPKAVELLRLPALALERTSRGGGAVEDLKSLLDGDPATLAAVEVSGNEPVTIVYGFGGQTVTLEKLAVHVPTAGKSGTPPRGGSFAKTRPASRGATRTFTPSPQATR